MTNTVFSTLAGYTIIEVNTESLLDQMIEGFYQNSMFSFDTETKSKDYGIYRDGALRKYDMEVDLASFATPDKRAYVVPLGMVCRPCLPVDTFFNKILDVMEDGLVRKIAWNFLYDGALYANYGVGCSNVEDMMVAAHLIDSSKGASLKTRCADAGLSLTPFKFKEYWNERHAKLTNSCDKKGNPKYSDIALADLEQRYVEYSAEDAIATMELYPVYTKRLAENKTEQDYYYRLLLPSLRVLFDMEREGMAVDQVYLRTIAAQCSEDLEKAALLVFQTVGRHFNLGSTKDLTKILYQDLGYPVYKTTDKGAPSTDAETLGKLAQNGYKVAEHILRWRGLSKLYSAYLDPDGGLKEHLYPDGRIHASFNICGTETGRLSVSNPGLQQTPRSTDSTYNIRKMVIPPRGYIMVGGDLSQAELRIMADRSGDANLVAEYLKDKQLWEAINSGNPIKGLPKSDLHQSTADGCGSTRNEAKGINFGELYGMSYKKLAAVLTSSAFDAYMEGRKSSFDLISDVVEPETALEYERNFFNKYPGIRSYQNHIKELVLKNGYAITRLGRRRYFPGAFSSDRWEREAAGRAGINHTIQGFVAELVLLCMCKASNVIPNPDGAALRKLKYRLNLQCHDEVQGTMPYQGEQSVLDAKYHLARIFQNPLPNTDSSPFGGLRVPMIFETRSGESWHDCH